MTDDIPEGIRLSLRKDTGRIVTAHNADLMALAHQIQDKVPGTWTLTQCLPAHPEWWGVEAPDPDGGPHGSPLLSWTPEKEWAEYVTATQPANLIPILAHLAYLENEVAQLRAGKGRYPKED